MNLKQFVTEIGIVVLAGCASYSFDGRGLVPGQSRANDVEAQMGAPSDRITLLNGSAIWYYTHGPMGHDTYAVRLSPDGVVQSIEQVLTVRNLTKLVPGVTTGSEAKEVLGPPWRITRMDRQQRNVWEYRMYNVAQDDYNLYVQLSYDGIVREVLLLKDYHTGPGGLRGRR
jgi:hypothetical protein